jgi:hypothetical protein
LTGSSSAWTHDNFLGNLAQDYTSLNNQGGI